MGKVLPSIARSCPILIKLFTGYHLPRLGELDREPRSQLNPLGFIIIPQCISNLPSCYSEGYSPKMDMRDFRALVENNSSRPDLTE